MQQQQNYANLQFFLIGKIKIKRFLMSNIYYVSM